MLPAVPEQVTTVPSGSAGRLLSVAGTSTCGTKLAPDGTTNVRTHVAVPVYATVGTTIPQKMLTSAPDGTLGGTVTWVPV